MLVEGVLAVMALISVGYLTRFAWQELFLPRAGAEETPSANPIVRYVAHPFAATAIAVTLAGYLAFSGDSRPIWPVFGASNQLLAALTLLAVTLYLVRRRMNFWVALLPMVFMVVISGWALVVLLLANWGKNMPLAVATAFLLAMAAVLAVQAAIALRKTCLERAS